MSSLMFLPLVRSGEEIEPRWERLIYVGPEPQAREILDALGPTRRERLLFGYLSDAPNLWGAISNVLSVADLAPSARLVKLIADKVVVLERRGGVPAHEMGKLQERHRQLVATSRNVS